MHLVENLLYLSKNKKNKRTIDIQILNCKL